MRKCGLSVSICARDLRARDFGQAFSLTMETGMNQRFSNSLFPKTVVVALCFVYFCASAQEKPSAQEKKGQFSAPGYTHRETFKTSAGWRTGSAAFGRASGFFGSLVPGPSRKGGCHAGRFLRSARSKPEDVRSQGDAGRKAFVSTVGGRKTQGTAGEPCGRHSRSLFI